jgi:malonyl-CoA O-methyltransferase
MKPDPTRNAIVAAFDAAAPTYDAMTLVQREVAEALVARAASRLAVLPKTILDLGAGTGHVTENALRQWPHAELTALDAAPAMLALLGVKFPGVATIHRDAARLDGICRYDLILSSMMLHWLAKPREALAHWRDFLAPGGMMMVALPVSGSLGEWRELTRAAGLADGLWAFPAENFAEDLCASAEIVDVPAVYPDAIAFLRGLKGTGAHKSRPDARPAPAAALRRLLARQSGPFTATFRVAFLTVRAE